MLCPIRPQFPHDYRYAGWMNLFDLLTETARADTELLSSSDELGDVFATLSDVDFSFETRERDRAEDFAQFVNGKQYGIAKVTELEAGQFRVLVVITMPITQHLIFPDRLSVVGIGRSEIVIGSE